MPVDPRLLRYYDEELEHLRGAGAEFAETFPKIAGRLGMVGMKVADPYVERLLEGFAFLTSRIRLRMDAEFPRFTQHLLEMVYPHYLAPTPSMLIARFQPNLKDTNLAHGALIARGQCMESRASQTDTSACRFTVAHDVTLWPLEISFAKYFTSAADLPVAMTTAGRAAKACVRVRLRSTAGLTVNALDLDKLCFYLSGNDADAYALYELCCAAKLGVMAGAPSQRHYDFVEPSHVRAVGFDDADSLLVSDLRVMGFHHRDVVPQPSRSFQGHRLLQEYFAFPHRFLFIEVSGLNRTVKRLSGNELEIVFLFDRGMPELEPRVSEQNFSLFCTPCINLFRQRCDPVDVNDSAHELHIVPKRERPMDFEVHQLVSFNGHGVGKESERRFLPFYSRFDEGEDNDHGYFTVRRESRMLSSQQRTQGFRSSYVGSEVFVSLVDTQEAPYRADLRQLTAVEALCTNRDLALQLSLGAGDTDFVLLDAAPVDAIRCIEGPTKPSAALAAGANAWPLISQLSLNYRSLFDSGEGDACAALRSMLSLYAAPGQNAIPKQIDGLKSLQARPVTRRLSMPGPIAFGRGLEIDLTVDDFGFEGASAFLFGAVMKHFFARYVSLNSFTETVLHTTRRGEIMRWGPQCGERPIA